MSSSRAHVSLSYENDDLPDKLVIPFETVARLPEVGDNVAIARTIIQEGSELRYEGRVFTIDYRVLEGHRFAVKAISPGDNLLSWGLSFGIAVAPLVPGNYVCNSRMLEALAQRNTVDFVLPTEPNFVDSIQTHSVDEATFQPAEQVAEHPQELKQSFMGYARGGGRGVGTRNYIIVIGSASATGCYARALEEQLKGACDAWPNVDGVVAVAHTEAGGSQRPNNFDLIVRTLSGFVVHPNVGAALVVDYGWEPVTASHVRERLQSEAGTPLLRDVTHEFRTLSGDFARDVAEGVELIKSWLPLVNEHQRSEQPVAELSVALQCGGSDAFSGVSGNPLAGWVARELLQQGGSAVLAETDELIGAESYILRRVRSLAVAQTFLAMVQRFKTRMAWHGQTAEANPSGGNNYRGLYNIGLKSLGAAKKKHAEVRLDDTLEYAERRGASRRRGYFFMDSPGNDIESIAGQVATGCNIIFFTTGNGSISNFPFVPTLKIITTSDRYGLLHKDMDVNAGRYQDGESMDVLGREMTALTLATASGQPSKGELAGHAQVSIWRNWHYTSFQPTHSNNEGEDVNHGNNTTTTASSSLPSRSTVPPAPTPVVPPPPPTPTGLPLPLRIHGGDGIANASASSKGGESDQGDEEGGVGVRRGDDGAAVEGGGAGEGGGGVVSTPYDGDGCSVFSFRGFVSEERGGDGEEKGGGSVEEKQALPRVLTDRVALVLPTSLCSGQVALLIARRLNARLDKERASPAAASTATDATVTATTAATATAAGATGGGGATGCCGGGGGGGGCDGRDKEMKVEEEGKERDSGSVRLSDFVSRFVALPHTEGCGSNSVGDDTLIYQRVMAGHATHPCVRAALCLEHGCEKQHNDAMTATLAQVKGLSATESARRFGWASVQADGGIDSVIAKVTHWFSTTLPLSPPLHPTRLPLSSLRLALYAPPALLLPSTTPGATSNTTTSSSTTSVPRAVGRTLAMVVRAVVGAGGRVVVPRCCALLECPEFLDELLDVRSIEPSLAYGEDIDSPSLQRNANINAAGASGTSRVVRGGCFIMAAPVDNGNPVEVLTGLAATGVHAVLLYTQRAAQSHPLVPTITLSSFQHASPPPLTTTSTRSGGIMGGGGGGGGGTDSSYFSAPAAAATAGFADLLIGGDVTTMTGSGNAASDDDGGVGGMDSSSQDERQAVLARQEAAAVLRLVAAATSGEIALRATPNADFQIPRGLTGVSV